MRPKTALRCITNQQQVDMVNRTQAPRLGHVTHIPIHQPRVKSMPNGQQVQLLPIGDQEVIRFDMLISAGKWHQQVPLVANFTAGLLKEGTADYSSREISELLDGTGGYLQIGAGMHHTTLSLFSLNKHVHTLLPLLQSVLYRPVFDAREMETYRRNRLQKYMNDAQKVNFLAAQYFKARIFGGKHPYGFFNSPDDYRKIKETDLWEYYQQALVKAPAQMLLTGNITDAVWQTVQENFGTINEAGHSELQKSFAFEAASEKRFHLHKKGAVQTAIQMGIKTISKAHPDFCAFLILNTILGGYFGSRLMRNIREEKGYTYGIASALVPYLHCGIFTIYTQTDNAFADKVLQEIQHEMDDLIQNPVPEAELEMVKNSLRGDLIRNMDHPFQMAETMHSLMEFGMDVSFIDHYLHTINTITPEKIHQIARQYLQNEFHIISVGG